MTQQKRWIIWTILGLFLIILGATSMFVVKEGEYKVIMQFGEAKTIKSSPGIHFKIPFIQSTTSLPKYQMIYDSTPSMILTKDKKPIIVDNYTVWRIENPQQFLRQVQSVEVARQRIEDAVFSTIKRNIPEIEFGEVVSEDTNRGNLSDKITKEVAELFKRDNYGIEIIDVRIKRTDLPEDNKASVYNRMISDRQSIAARYLSEGDEESRKITSKADREAQELIAQAEAEAKKIIAAGEQEAAQIYNQAYGKDAQFYKLYRTLESYVKTFQGEPVIMLPIDSPYAKILLGNQ